MHSCMVNNTLRFGGDCLLFDAISGFAGTRRVYQKLPRFRDVLVLWSV